jgi:hypothetical protein
MKRSEKKGTMAAVKETALAPNVRLQISGSVPG